MYTIKDFNTTIKVVEARLEKNTSDNPTRDLQFLSNQYRRRGEWDKANAATRQLIRIAEGETTVANYEITPVDIELALDHKRFLRQLRLHTLRQTPAFVCLFFILTGSLLGLTHPEWIATICPWNQDALLCRAMYNTRHHQNADALADCDRVLAMDPNKNLAKLLKSEIFFNEGRLDDALALAKQTKKTLRSNNLLGSIFFQMGDVGKMHQFNADLARDANTSVKFKALNRNSFTSAMSGDYNTALEQAHEAELIASNDREKTDINILLSRILLRLKQFPEAERHASAAIALRMDRGMARLYRSEARLGMKRYAEALEDVNYTLYENPFFGRAYAARAAAFTGLGELANAVYSLNMAEHYQSSPDEII